MVLKIPDLENIFPHSRKFEDGQGKTRTGSATIIISKDGSGDTDDIQEGIDMLPPGGGVVFIKEGSYSITKKITFPIDEVALVGTGYGTEITTSSDITLVDISTRNRIHIEKILFKGTNDNTDTNNHGIEHGLASENRITNCWFTQFGGSAIKLINALDVIIDANILEDNFGDVIDITGGAATIANNVIGNASTTNKNSGVVLTSGSNTKIIGNKFNNLLTHAIFISGGSENLILGNVCSWASTDGIRLTSADRCVVSSNRMYNCQGVGINLTNAACDKNIIIGNILLNNGTAFTDTGTNTHPNGASGTNNLAVDDLNIIA